jgi:hypothetical protein
LIPLILLNTVDLLSPLKGNDTVAQNPTRGYTCLR